jgi:sigma-E factor negative regulatory protein RseB
VSRRPLLLVGATSGLVVVAAASLAVLGSAVPEASPHSAGWAGWTGKVDQATLDDRAAMTPDDAAAVRLLARASKASSTLAWSGRSVTQDGGGSTTTELVHVPGRGTLARASAMPASKATFAPDGGSRSFADDGRPLALLRVNYRVLREADLDAPVAGRAADAVVAVNAEGAVAARFWIDHSSGLLLRRELLDGKGAVWSRTSLETVAYGPVHGVTVPATTVNPWSEVLDEAALRKRRQAGCLCPESLPGGLTLLDATRAPAGAVASQPVIHQLFSDGLVSVSLFSMQVPLSDSDVAGLTDRGFRDTDLDGRWAYVRLSSDDSANATVVWQSGESVLTLVTDGTQDPMPSAAAVVAAFPPSPEEQDNSLLARVQRGWHRVFGARS